MKVRMNKKNKEVWIFGRGARSDRPIHWPPVTPWIDYELRDEIIAMFEAAMRGDDTSEQKRALGRQRVNLEDRAFLSPVQRRQLEKVKKEIAALEARRPGDDKIHQDARRQAMMLHLMRGVREVRVETVVPTRIAPPCIVLNTSPIAINGIVLGTYDVWFHPRGKVPKDAFFLRRRDHVTEQGPHPHWNSYGCFGTYGPVFQSLLSKKQYGTLLGTFLQYLAVYDAGSPLICLSEFEERAWRNEDPLA